MYNPLHIIKDQIESDSVYERLDESRQHDVIQCLMAIKTSKNPEEVRKARRALKAIYEEFNDARLRDVRRWLLRERKAGRHENVKNFYEDVEKDRKKWNPYG